MSDLLHFEIYYLRIRLVTWLVKYLLKIKKF